MSILVALVALASAAGCGSSSIETGPGAATVQLEPIPAYRQFGDCNADTPDSVACRITDEPRRSEVERRLGDRTAVAWGERAQWTIAYRAPDDSITALDVMGGIQLPLSKIEGTRLWALALRMPRADEAVISTSFLLRHGNQRQRDTTSLRQWRGPNAPAEPDASANVAGTIWVDSLWSNSLDAWRRVTVYLPPGQARNERIPVIYFADGQAVGSYARVVDQAIASGQLPPVALVGIWVSTGAPGGGPPMGVAQDLRSIEYHEGVESVPGADSAFVVKRYRDHKRFFTEDVRRWAEDSLFVSNERELRGVHGSSSGGHFALILGQERPDLYGLVIANSNSVVATPPAGDWRKAARYHLSAGVLEQPSIVNSLTTLGDSLKQHGIPHVVNIYPSGHDSQVWKETLPQAIGWWLAPDATDR